MYMKSYNETMFFTPIQVKMYGVCFIIIIIWRGTFIRVFWRKFMNKIYLSPFGHDFFLIHIYIFKNIMRKFLGCWGGVHLVTFWIRWWFFLEQNCHCQNTLQKCIIKNLCVFLVTLKCIYPNHISSITIELKPDKNL
jgi:hypothetical protein